MTLRSAAGVALPLLTALTGVVAWLASSGPAGVDLLASMTFMPLVVLTCAVLQFLIVHARRSESSRWMLLSIPLLALAGVALIGGTCAVAISRTPPESTGYQDQAMRIVLFFAAVVWAAASGLLFVFELVRLALEARSPEPS